MLRFRRKKAMYDFYKKHRAFLFWYLNTQCSIPEKLYYLVIRYFVKCLKEDFGKVIFLDEIKQRKWIVERIKEFATEEMR